ncbi:uncharacterized protein BO97DRAFT_412635 [Aspergillus homomorphus CBS 101889]|uniref:Major facilitator superfamily transporter n=1 Tax=Aspergillus homomorphus (strain CBS 101889) TaxID=1450537 RepID=A0A395I3Y0_ASPHC|nr:major facilitator superfamily transporter [Aspergillus homomorphus CBS 101889]RAL14313.1 major facilitator superfamily transporter [Aspergillus homomorphus CBS 101889]
MHILCLHGAGSNSRIFEIQTAAIRYELEDNHTYDFVEGNIPAPMQPGIEVIANKHEQMYAYIDEKDPASGVAAYQHLEALLHHEGPYDGVIAFSQAGTLILTYLAHLAKHKSECKLPFKFAIILSITYPPLDYEAVQRGEVKQVDLEAYKDVIPIPTAHIWGSQDGAANKVPLTNTVCKAETIGYNSPSSAGSLWYDHIRAMDTNHETHTSIHDSHNLHTQPSSASLAEGLNNDTPGRSMGNQPRYMQGPRLWFAGCGIALSLFLATAEITIISTSLVTISRHLDGQDQSTWIITSYLLAFAGFLTVWAKCSDFIGLKLAILVSLAIFVAFSGGCAATQTMSQLIICRAFQGIGGSGVFSSCLFGLIRMVPPERFDIASAAGSGVLTLALILVLTWVASVPAGVVAWAIISILVPKDFDQVNSTKLKDQNPRNARKGPWSFLTKADTVGCLLLLSFSVLFVAAFQEANVRYAWSSATIISLLAISGALLAAFVAWEWMVANRQYLGFEPILPWGILRNRVLLGAILFVRPCPPPSSHVPRLTLADRGPKLYRLRYSGCFLTGPAVTILYIELPQRFQTVNDSSAIGAGLKVLTFGVGSPVGAALCSLLAGRLRTPFVYLAAAGSVLQIVGAFLLSSVPATPDIWPGQYGYMAITGLGIGISIAALYMCVPVVVGDTTDQPTAMGLTLQARMIGASLGVAIVNSILIDYVKAHLPGTEAAADPNLLGGVPTEVQEEIRRVYALGYNRQMYAVGAFGAAQLIAVALMWKREQVRFVK